MVCWSSLCLKSGFAKFEAVTGDLTEVQKWDLIVFAGLIWIFLTARSGVLLGAIDAYLLAPLQVGLDRRSLERNDFLVGDKLGEGYFGIVYSGVIVPRNVSAEERVPTRGGRKALDMDGNGRFKEKVVLKKVKVGVQGAEECGDYEEWFNYRLSTAAPETCAESLGSFVADKTNSQIIKGAKWLVWKFEGDRRLADYVKDRRFPLNTEPVMFGHVLQGVESVKQNALIIKQIMHQIIT